jgi:hypothetical protein
MCFKNWHQRCFFSVNHSFYAVHERIDSLNYRILLCVSCFGWFMNKMVLVNLLSRVRVTIDEFKINGRIYRTISHFVTTLHRSLPHVPSQRLLPADVLLLPSSHPYMLAITSRQTIP